MTIGIAGLGLIGGSIALDLKAFGHLVSGYDLNEEHVHKALELSIIDDSAELDVLCKQCEVIIIAIPVDHIEKLAQTVLDKIDSNTVVIDVGSTKKEICESVVNHEKRGRFVAAHPLAGTEYSGPKAALNNLFKGKKNIICAEELSDEDAIEMAITIFDQLGMQNIFMDPDLHDQHMAYVSHLSHVSSFMLGLTVLDIQKDSKQIANLASTGFESTVRLAKSNPDTWSAIFTKNQTHLSTALGAYIKHLSEFKRELDAGNEKKIKSQLTSANRIKRVLHGIKHNIFKLS